MSLPVLWRAVAAQWRPRLATLRRNVSRDRHALASLGLVILGLGGGLAGGALVGEWCLGLVLIAESAGLVMLGLQRDDGTGRAPGDGDQSLAAILERARRAP